MHEHTWADCMQVNTTHTVIVNGNRVLGQRVYISTACIDPKYARFSIMVIFCQHSLTVFITTLEEIYLIAGTFYHLLCSFRMSENNLESTGLHGKYFLKMSSISSML